MAHHREFHIQVIQFIEKWHISVVFFIWFWTYKCIQLQWIRAYTNEGKYFAIQKSKFKSRYELALLKASKIHFSGTSQPWNSILCQKSFRGPQLKLRGAFDPDSRILGFKISSCEPRGGQNSWDSEQFWNYWLLKSIA